MLICGLVLMATSSAYAQIYKCTSAEKKTIYTDKACAIGSLQTITEISKASTQGKIAESTINKQLDEAVKLAITNDDLVRAQALASSKEQKQWVVEAKKEASRKNLASRTDADARMEQANSYACQQAQRNLQKETDTTLPDQNAIAAKTSLMQTKCGFSDPRYANRYPTIISSGYQRPGFFNPGWSHQQAWPVHIDPGYTSEPYDRTRASPFGSRWIRPEN